MMICSVKNVSLKRELYEFGSPPAILPLRTALQCGAGFATESQTRPRNVSPPMGIDGPEAALALWSCNHTTLSRSVLCPKLSSRHRPAFSPGEAENVVPVAVAHSSGARASTLLPFRCPKTSRLMNTAIETDYASLAKSWTLTMKIVCAYCGETHIFQVRDAYIDAAMSNERMPG
jgi:hypothetical protein